MTVQQNAVLCREYLDWLLNTCGRTSGTVYNYASVLTPFLEMVGDRPLSDVKVHDVEGYVRRPRGGRARGGTASAATQQKDVVIIRAFYDFLVKRGALRTSPVALLRAPKVSNENPRPISDDHWNDLWSCAATPVERVFLGLGFFAGLRRREMTELRPDHIFAKRGAIVNFRRKGGGDDTTPYADMAEVIGNGLPRLLGYDTFPTELAKYARERRHAAFLVEWGEMVPAPMRERVVHALPEGATDPNLLNKRMRTLCVRAHSDHYTPHQLRHSTATNLLRSSVPLHIVQRLMNHSSPQITMRYVRAGASELREWMATVNRHDH